MLTCTLKLSGADNAEVTTAFEFHPDQLTKPSTKLSFDQSFEVLKQKAIAIRLDTDPVLPSIGLKCVESIQAVIDGLNKIQGLVGETTSPITVTKLSTKTGWMIVIQGS
jgi:hypothetical protein